MSEFIIAIGLVFVIEGLLYAAFPNAMRRMLSDLMTMPEQALRTVGMISVGLGVLIVWFVKG